jgi:hypothetical protein
VQRIPIRSGCGALPSLDNCLNFSREMGMNFLNCENLLFPIAGNVSGEGNSELLVFNFYSCFVNCFVNLSHRWHSGGNYAHLDLAMLGAWPIIFK